MQISSANSLDAAHELPEEAVACPQCQSGPEYYRMLFDLYKFDVDLAREIVSDGREAIEMDSDDVAYAVERCEIYEPHLAHVDTKYPGIIAHYWYPEADGTFLQGTVLIDGHHRAAKTLQLNIPFYAHLLTEEESLRITERAPDFDTVYGQGKLVGDGNDRSAREPK